MHLASAQPRQMWGSAWGVRQTFLLHGPGLGPGLTPGPAPPLQTPTGTLRDEGTLQSLHSPCRMCQKNQTSMETSRGEIAAVAPAWERD